MYAAPLRYLFQFSLFFGDFDKRFQPGDSHHVEVTIQDGYAITWVDQLFSNPRNIDLEALYAFPIPDKAAASEFTIWIDGKPVQGEVHEREEARNVYEEERRAGRDAGLTEKEDYRRFEVKVSPVRAGQDTRVRLVYMQPAHVVMGDEQFTARGIERRNRDRVAKEHQARRQRASAPVQSRRVDNSRPESKPMFKKPPGYLSYRQQHASLGTADTDRRPIEDRRGDQYE